MHIYDIAVIGGGPAGAMASIRAGQKGEKTILLEKNPVIGKKLLLTGKGRCNITNNAPTDDFVRAFGTRGPFYRPAFFSFSNRDLMDFFTQGGLTLKSERQGRVFPVTDRSADIITVLKKYLKESKATVIFNTRVQDISRKESLFQLYLSNSNIIRCHKVIISTGGASYGKTGSTGDGYRLAKKLGHTIGTLQPGLVPLKTREKWPQKLQGLALKNIRITFKSGSKKIVSSIGELMFTHFGVSGPLVLDLSARILSLLGKNHEVKLFIDLKPGLQKEQLTNRLIRDFRSAGPAGIKKIMKNLLPAKLAGIFPDLAGLPPEQKANQVTRQQRHKIIDMVKALPLTVTGSLRLESAMITCGGISAKEINPRSMESRITPGLYFAGEIIDGCAPSGGYNLQQAFSTGWLAGNQASYA